MAPMPASKRGQQWLDELTAPDPKRVEQMLSAFWHRLRRLAEILDQNRPRYAQAASFSVDDENLLAVECLADLRATVIDMMLALNGIARPVQTVNLNAYLSANQRTALERTLLAPEIGAATWIGQAVSLVVIYRWYAPQLVERFGLAYPSELEEDVWATLRRHIYDWPADISTDSI